MLCVSVLAFTADRGIIPKQLVHHRVIYTLSLGAYAGAWTMFGALSYAQTSGYTYLAFYFGTSALFLFSPLFIQPLLHLTSTYKLSSLADLLSFRYCSQVAGTVAALGILVGVLPLMAIQIEVFVGSAKLIHANSSPGHFHANIIEWLLFFAIAGFTLIFGTGVKPNRSYHQGLVFSLAMQSAFKLLVFLLLGFTAIYAIFGGTAELEQWLSLQPDKLTFLNASLSSDDSRILILIFFAASMAMPHMFHLVFNENANNASIQQASWGFPLYLLLLSLPVFPIIWASEYLQPALPGHFAPLTLGYWVANPKLSLLAFIVLLSAILGSLSVIILAVASMCLNHLILPFLGNFEKIRLIENLNFIKRILVVFITFLGFSAYWLASGINTLNALSYATYTAIFQFLPGILAVLYWPRANRAGLLSGLLLGFSFWTVSIFLPLTTYDVFGLQPYLLQWLDLGQDSYWFLAAALCLGVNMLCFGLVSYFTHADEEQRYVAQICSQDGLGRPLRQQLKAQSVTEFRQALAREVGNNIAEREIDKALASLNMKAHEKRPFALRLLRRQIESNLSGLFGPTVARQMVARNLPYQQGNVSNSEDLQLIEHRLETARSSLTGLAGELDQLRRYHRNTIENLPIGICSIDSKQEVLLWNIALVNITGITSQEAIGSDIANLNEPWQSLINNFLLSEQTQLFKTPLIIDEQQRWFTLHKTVLLEPQGQADSQTLLIEEVSPLVQLEKELLHNERLASIGRLAAGVAHEIGNPITGIACLAQNLKFDSDSPAINETAKDILAQTDRVTRIVQSLVNFSHAGSHNNASPSEPVNLYACVDDAIHLLSLNYNEAAAVIDNQVDPQLYTEGQTQALLQVFINLIKNALQALNGQANASIVIHSQTQNQHVLLYFDDNGPGISSDVQETIFEPFFTTKEPGEGTGLGLSLVYNMIEEHGGQIKVQSPIAANKPGCRFVISLPWLADNLPNIDETVW